LGSGDGSSTPSSFSSAEVFVVERINYVLGVCYILLGILCLIQVILKYKVEKKLKTNVVFPAEMLFLCIVRTSLFFAQLTSWATDSPEYASAFAFFIDTFPSSIFSAIYLLLVASWGITWAKARRARPFQSRQFWLIYSGAVATMFFTTIVLTFVTAELHLPYTEVLRWEAYYEISTAATCVLAALIFGLMLYRMLGESVARSNYLLHVMRQLLFLLLLATASFALKGACIFSILTSVRNEWLSGNWSDTSFGIFWFFFYFITELLPFLIVWFVLQRKDTNKKSAARGGSDSGSSSKNFSLLNTPLNQDRQYDYQNANQLGV